MGGAEAGRGFYVAEFPGFPENAFLGVFGEIRVVAQRTGNRDDGDIQGIGDLSLADLHVDCR
jgi:hypothetical protein